MEIDRAIRIALYQPDFAAFDESLAAGSALYVVRTGHDRDACVTTIDVKG